MPCWKPAPPAQRWTDRPTLPADRPPPFVVAGLDPAILFHPQRTPHDRRYPAVSSRAVMDWIAFNRANSTSAGTSDPPASRQSANLS